MDFPVFYTGLILPKLLLHMLTILSYIRKFVSALFTIPGVVNFLEPKISFPTRPESCSNLQSMSAELIRELLPVVKFFELVDPPENCAVCLCEFNRDDDIRRLTNCRHVFHRSCLDRWMDHDQRTCPLCRTPFIAEEMVEVLNEKLLLASGISDFYGDYSPITTGL